MKILLTKTNSVFSKLIMNITNEDCSHFALEFPKLGIVCHANLLGVHLEWSKNFKKKNIIVEEYNIDCNDCTDRLDRILSKYEFKPYDLISFFFTGINILTKGTFSHFYKNVDIPDAFTCTEFGAEFFNLNLKFTTTPRQLLNIIKENIKK